MSLGSPGFTKDFPLGFASPPYTFGYDGNASNNTWLFYFSKISSNKTGAPIRLEDGIISEISIRTATVETYDISLYEHDGNLTNSTLIDTFSVVASTGEDFKNLDLDITQGKQLAIRITSGSSKDIIVEVVQQGIS